MKRLALILTIFLVACGTGPVAEHNPYDAHPDAVQAGAKLYRQHCAECHGAEATGGKTAPSLRTAHVDARSDRALFNFVTNGNLRRGMPAWSRLPEERRWQIVTYLRAINTGTSQTPAPAR